MYSSERASKMESFIHTFGILFVSRVRYGDLRQVYPRFTEVHDRIMLSAYGMSTREDEYFDLTDLSLDMVSIIDRTDSISEMEFQFERLWFHNRQLSEVYLKTVEKLDSNSMGSYLTLSSDIVDNVVRPKATEIIYEFILNVAYKKSDGE